MTLQASWDENSVFEKSKQFLAKKKDELQIHLIFWRDAEKCDFNKPHYSERTIKCAEKVREIAINSIREIQALQTEIEKITDEKYNVLDQNKIKKLIEVMKSVNCGLKYFRFIAGTSIYTDGIKKIKLVSAYLFPIGICAAIASSAAYMIGYTFPPIIASYILTPSICMSGLNFFGAPLYDNFIQNWYHETRSAFEKTLGPREITLELKDFIKGDYTAPA